MVDENVAYYTELSSQKVKHQYSILTHIYGIQKDGNDDLYVRQPMKHRCKEQSFGLCGRRQVSGDLRG